MFYYECLNCGKTYKPGEILYLCPQCPAEEKPGNLAKRVLTVKFDYDYIKSQFDKFIFDWNLFSAIDKKYFPDFVHGKTPFFKSDRLSKKTGFKNIWLKNDSLNPSGSLKDRASFLVVAQAVQQKINTVVTASTGNAGSSLAAVCAAAGKKAVIFVPSSAPKAKLIQMNVYGAEVKKVKGTYDDAFKLSIEYSSGKKVLNRNTAYNPFTIEGKKSAGLEIYRQNNLKAPDVIFVPVGDGVIISGIYKAFYDLKMSRLIQKIPRLICVQSEKSNAVHNFIKTGIFKTVKNPVTVADSISVSSPANAYMARNAVIDSGGFSVTVSDKEIMRAQFELASLTGIYAEPSSASVYAALNKLKRDSKINKNEQIVLLITGSGLKDVEATEHFV